LQLACQDGIPRHIWASNSSKMLIRNALEAMLLKQRHAGDCSRAFRFDDELWSC
jgi:hypothetical protein